MVGRTKEHLRDNIVIQFSSFIKIQYPHQPDLVQFDGMPLIERREALPTYSSTILHI